MGDNVYYLFDCPGQLELYSHYDIIKRLTSCLKRLGINICSVFCLDSTFLQEKSKFISGTVLSLAALVQLELPHMTILTKADLIHDKNLLENIQELDPKSLSLELNPLMGKKMFKLNQALTEFIDNFSLIDFLPLNPLDEDNINEIMYHADSIIQYYENQEPKEEYYKNIENNIKEDDYDENYYDYNMK